MRRAIGPVATTRRIVSRGTVIIVEIVALGVVRQKRALHARCQCREDAVGALHG